MARKGRWRSRASPSVRVSRALTLSSCSPACGGPGWSTACAGPGGGYCLARDVPEISIAEVIAAVDESVDATRCGGRENCQDNQPCLTHGLWEGLGREIERYLGRVSLADVLRQQRVREVALRQNAKFAEHHGYPARPVMEGQEAVL